MSTPEDRARHRSELPVWCSGTCTFFAKFCELLPYLSQNLTKTLRYPALPGNEILLIPSGMEASEQVLCADAACCAIRCSLHAACSARSLFTACRIFAACCKNPPSMLHFPQLAACCLLHAECRTFRCLALLGETGPSSGRDQRMDGNNEKCASLKRSAQHAVKMQSACYRKCSARALNYSA